MIQRDAGNDTYLSYDDESPVVVPKRQINLLDHTGTVTETVPASAALGVCENTEVDCPNLGRETTVYNFITGSETRWQLCRRCIDDDDYCELSS